MTTVKPVTNSLQKKSISIAGTQQQTGIAVSPDDFFNVTWDCASHPEFLADMEEPTVKARATSYPHWCAQT